MISRKKLAHIRRKTHWPSSELDTEIATVARSMGNRGLEYYAAVVNPSTSAIYQYLSGFVAAVADANFQRERKHIRILDWGGGKGYVTYFLTQEGFSPTLYETDSFPHKDLWKAYKFDITTSEGSTLPFDDGSFDIVVGFGVLEHVPYDYEALKELNRVLKNDGLLLCFNLPRKWGYLHKLAEIRGVRYHDRLYGVKETMLLLKRAGFNTIGKPWARQLFPKNSMHYKHPLSIEKLDLSLCRYTPLRLFATSLEFVARKQHTYTAPH